MHACPAQVPFREQQAEQPLLWMVELADSQQRLAVRKRQPQRRVCGAARHVTSWLD
jgi:hypothetical protein